MDLSVYANDFEKIFKGNTEAYGLHDYGEETEAGEKRNGNSRTVKGTPGYERYLNHLKGKQGLGIVPINTDNEVSFCALDIDIYDEHEKKRFDVIIKSLEYQNAPMAIFRTKSGGFHFYVFFEEPVQAKEGLTVLRKYADVFGIKKTASTYQKQPLEFFPKQETLSAGKAGNWINLPYFGNGILNQKMMLDGRLVELDEALNKIKTHYRKTIESHENYIAGLEMHDAPPCLQTITLLREPPGGRNNFLFSMGVYLMKKDEDSFEARMYEANKKLDDPLPEDELDTTIIASLRKQEYSYKCKESPCQNFCDKRECSKREFGLGDSGEVSNITLGQITKIQVGADCHYDWMLDNKEVKFDNEEMILNQKKFQAIIMRELQVIPLSLKPNVWYKMVNKCLANMEIKELVVGSMEGESSEVYTCLGKYLERKSTDKSKAALFEGLVYRDTKKHKFLVVASSFKAFAVKYGIPRTELPKRLTKIFTSLDGVSTVTNVEKPSGLKTTKHCYEIPFEHAAKIMDESPYELTEETSILKRAQEIEDERLKDYGKNDGEELY